MHLSMFNFVVGGDNEGPWLMPDILVNVHRAGEESVGVIKEVLPVCWPRNVVSRVLVSLHDMKSILILC